MYKYSNNISYKTQIQQTKMKRFQGKYPYNISNRASY